MTRGATTAVIGAAALALAAVAGVQLQAAGDLAVAVTYKGKGPVDEAHEILVFLFDHPVPGPDSLPLALSTVTKNGGTATFKNISAETVYVINGLRPRLQLRRPVGAAAPGASDWLL